MHKNSMHITELSSPVFAYYRVVRQLKNEQY